MNIEIIKDFVQRGQRAQAAVDEIIEATKPLSTPSPKAVQLASDPETIKILTAQLRLKDKQIRELQVTLDSLLSILKWSPAESGDNEIACLLSDFRQNWPSA